MKWVAALLALFSRGVGADCVVAVTAQDITAAEIIQILTSEQTRYSDGTRVHLVMLPQDHFSTRLLASDLGTTPSSLYRRLRQLVDMNRIEITEVATERELLRLVATTPGSIGYARTYSVTLSGTRLKLLDLARAKRE